MSPLEREELARLIYTTAESMGRLRTATADMESKWEDLMTHLFATSKDAFAEMTRAQKQVESSTDVRGKSK